MVEQVAERYRVRKDRFMMHGFSGGGQFAHRFFYLHPDRLRAVSIGAPGTVTLPDQRDWWVGTGGMETVFGKPLRLGLMRDVAVQYVIGSEDTETWDVTVSEKSNLWRPGINDSGATRIDRLRSLESALAGHGIQGRFDIVPGVAHEGGKIQDPVRDFFREVMRRQKV